MQTLFPLERIKKEKKEVCRCSAYPFPHRRSSGKCTGDHSFCSSCGQSAIGQWCDFGIGPYEYGGAPGIDIDSHFVSECCEATMIDWTGREIDSNSP